MPLYDYRCTVCGREVEVMHRMAERGPEVCESCGGTMRKALSPPAIHFKGSGWAKKDAASSARSTSKTGAAASSDKDSPKAGSGSEESSSGASSAAKQDKPASSAGVASD